jgi:dolichyl-phosphate beta-glucosyltransferase
VVSDGSTDSTEAIVNDLKTKYKHLKLIKYKKNRGKGYALKQGMAATKGDFALFMDADEATPVSELAKLAKPLLAGEADIAIASRSVSSSDVATKQPIHRQIVGRMFSLTTRILLGMPFRDTQCGFKLFKGEVARDLFENSSCEGFAFDVEILANAVASGLKIEEIGVIWHDQPGSKVNPVIHGIKMLKVVLTLALKKRGSKQSEQL